MIDGWIITLIVAAAFISLLLGIFAYILAQRRNMRDYMGLESNDLRWKVVINRETVDPELRLFFANSDLYSFVKLLPDIGKLNSRHCMVKDKSNSCRLIASFKQIKSSAQTPNLDIVRNIMHSITHPYILQPHELTVCNQQQLISIYEYREKGSLRDLINRVSPLKPYRLKYNMEQCGKGLKVSKVRRFSRQILQALSYLLDNDIPYFHLCSTNVYVDDSGDFIQLASLELSLFDFEFEHQKLLVPATFTREDIGNCMEKILVIQFGHILYEMVTGQKPDAAWPTFLSLGPSKDIHEALELIFGKFSPTEAINHAYQLPSIGELLKLNAFSNEKDDPMSFLSTVNFARSIGLSKSDQVPVINDAISYGLLAV